MFSRVRVVSGACFGLALCCHASASAAEPASLRDFLFGPAAKLGADISLPAVARYESERGEGFVLDRSGGRRAVLKFDDSGELWALTASPGPRGDVIYRNDVGEAVLRATRLGGLTLFTPDVPAGTAAAPLGAVQSLRPAQIYGPEALFQVLLQAEARANRAVQHIIVFDAADANVSPGSEPLFADAFILTADAIVHVSGRGPPGHAAASHVVKVRFVQGPGAAAVLVGRMVQITVAPDMGVAGRPSSERIAAAIWRH
ncbi:DUF4908 domain-containing protein [Caulobacter sp. S45]|uniref:DUF4908 domain-containing protein n=1 Tax=Caulobacter sp. S45 TaxID=1641861 RepID=UPI001577553B|nr:DUF4908 domain-containing protein [Caulobacter sp. S45]